MTTTIEPGTIPGPAPAPEGTDPVPPTQGSVPPVREAVPPTERAVPPAQESVPSKRERDRAGTVMRWLMWGLILGGLVISTIGFAASYTALRDLALAKGFGAMSRYVPIGIDVGIVVMYGWDLVLAWRRKPKPMLRWIGHALTFATIAFNASAMGKPLLADLVGAGYHAAMPILFIAMVEAARHLVIRTAQVRLGESSHVGLHRWLLAPWQTWLLWRRMKLWEMSSHQVVELEKSRKVYRAWLQHKYGKQWRKKARAEELLPFTLASYGLGVEEALRLPQEKKEAERAREAAERDLRAAEAAEEESRRIEAERRTAKAAIERRRIAAMVTAADHEIEAETTTAEAEARVATTSAAARAETAAKAAQLAAETELRKAERDAADAERRAVREEEAKKSAVEAEALAREGEALRLAAVERKTAAEAAAVAAREEKKSAEEAHAAEEYRLLTTRLARDQKVAEAEAAEAEQRTVQAREEAARAERAAREAEDAARLTPRARDDRRVARMLLAAGVTSTSTDPKDKERVSLEEIGAALKVQSSAASKRRQSAYDLILAGYTG